MKLPAISGKECVKALTKANFYIRRQTGSHIIMRRDHPFSQTTIPNHNIIDKGTLRAILNQCHITKEEFDSLLKS